VKFLGSKTAQDIVAKAGVVFPAVAASMPAAEAAFASKGWDVTPFLEPVQAGDVFPFPANPNAADVTAVMTPAMDAVMSFEAEPGSLAEANDEVNKILSANT
jgi:multiple sugar transport system substrate-binding protein